ASEVKLVKRIARDFEEQRVFANDGVGAVLRFLQGAHVAEELPWAEDGHAAAAHNDFDGAAEDDEDGGAGMAGVEERLAAGEFEEGADAGVFLGLGGGEAVEGGEVREEGFEVEGGLRQALCTGQWGGLGFLRLVTMA